MINKTRSLRTTGFGIAAAALLLLVTAAASAQRDPFAKPSYKRERKAPSASGAPGAKAAAAPKVVPNFGPPGIEARIEYFKVFAKQLPQTDRRYLGDECFDAG